MTESFFLYAPVLINLFEINITVEIVKKYNYKVYAI